VIAAIVVVAAIAAFGIVGGTGLAGHSIGAGQYQYGLNQYQYGLNQAGLGQYQYGRFVFLCHRKHRGRHWRGWRRAKTIVVSVNAMAAHLRHGDVAGRCGRRGIVFVGPGLKKDDDDHRGGKFRNGGLGVDQSRSDRKKHDDDDDDD
jgi:hypothetical protein